MVKLKMSNPRGRNPRETASMERTWHVGKRLARSLEQEGRLGSILSTAALDSDVAIQCLRHPCCQLLARLTSMQTCQRCALECTICVRAGAAEPRTSLHDGWQCKNDTAMTGQDVQEQGWPVSTVRPRT